MRCTPTLLLALVGLAACSADPVSTTTPAPPESASSATAAATAAASVVRVTGSQGNWQLTVDGQPYVVKGAAWGPDISGTTVNTYMADLQSLGVNTTRTWGTGTSTQTLLDAAAAKGVKIVMGFWLQQQISYSTDQPYKDRTLREIKRWVNTYKSHPGVLMWDVGNEVILFLQDHYSGTQLEANRVAYAQYVNQLAAEIHAIDPNHPVTSTDAWTGAWPYYKNYSPNLDLLAVNSYGAVCSIKNDWIAGGYTKPYIVTEWGPHGEWEVPNDANGVPTEPSDLEKRDAYPNAWGCITGHTGVALGGTLFIYGDKEDFGGIWFNILHPSTKRLSYYSVRQMYTGQPTTGNTPPQIQSITLSQTANIKAGTTFTVNVGVLEPNGDPVTYALKQNSKYINGSTSIANATYTQTGANTFTVTAPTTVGVWKLYVYAYDGQGNIGIDSRSFGVVK
jgi:exo-beta-1,3-glucanase (GH17 family)